MASSDLGNYAVATIVLNPKLAPPHLTYTQLAKIGDFCISTDDRHTNPMVCKCFRLTGLLVTTIVYVHPGAINTWRCIEWTRTYARKNGRISGRNHFRLICWGGIARRKHIFLVRHAYIDFLQVPWSQTWSGDRPFPVPVLWPLATNHYELFFASHYDYKIL